MSSTDMYVRGRPLCLSLTCKPAATTGVQKSGLPKNWTLNLSSPASNMRSSPTCWMWIPRMVQGFWTTKVSCLFDYWSENWYWLVSSILEQIDTIDGKLEFSANTGNNVNDDEDLDDMPNLCTPSDSGSELEDDSDDSEPESDIWLNKKVESNWEAYVFPYWSSVATDHG